MQIVITVNQTTSVDYMQEAIDEIREVCQNNFDDDKWYFEINGTKDNYR